MRHLPIAACASVLVLVTGCGLLPTSHRDLASVADQRTCVETKPGQPIYFGYYPIENLPRAATIEKVYLVGQRDLALNAVYLVPIRGGDTATIAIASHNPKEVSGWDWDRARPALGASVSLQDTPLDLVISVSTDRIGKARSLRMDYRMGSRRFYSVWPRQLKVSAQPQGCSGSGRSQPPS